MSGDTIPLCPWCGKAPKHGVREGRYYSLGCRGRRSPEWHGWNHDLVVWSWTREGAESRWLRLVNRLKKKA